MGASYLGDDENLTQWSNGQYFGANNTQDDLTVITGSNGFSYAADDHGNNFTTATALTGLTFSSFGVIERNTDIDMFRFETLAGQVSFNIVNASRAFVGSAGSYVTEYLTSRGANLDIAASLYRADGSLLQTFNPADLTTASFSTFLDAGTYYLGIDGVGFGTPLASSPSGYTDYGSLGQYMLSGTLPSTTTQPPPPPTSTLQVLDPNGTVQLLRDTSTDLVSIQANGITTPVSMSGSQIKVNQFTGWQILAAEANSSGQNQLLWKQISDGKFYTWTLNSQGNWISSSSGYTASSSQGLLFQQQFMVDANGTPLSSQTLNTATDGASALIANGNSALVDPIIGSTQGFAPDLGLDPAHDFDHDHGAYGDFLPLDLTTFDPGLLLGVLATTGEADRTPADPMASLFPAAGSIPSPTTPWLAATQSLL
jgi:hypothetical protein